MTHQPDTQLSKASFKATALLLEQLELEHQQLGGAITVLRARLARSGYESNGHVPAEKTDADAARIVGQARAMLDERPSQTPVRRSPEQWREAILTLLRHGPMHRLVILDHFGRTNRASIYATVNALRKARLIVQAGLHPAGRNGHTQPLFALATKHKGVTGKVRHGYSHKVKAQRAKTAKLLDTLDRQEPRPLKDARQAGVLARRGYLTRVSPGLYLRTDKPFSVERSA